MRVCIAAPDGPGAHPLVIVMCHTGGLDAFTEDRVDRLAAMGLIAAAPDVFHHHAWIEEREARRASLRDRRIVNDIRASIAHACQNDDTEPSPADVNRLEEEFARHAIECEFHRFDGAGHAFQNFLGPERSRAGPAEQSWARTLEFLARRL